ncbi:MAG: Crp/Fnr family transcriptional regulator [Pseudolabrys sp.]|nr:Crp/Fnr family transcriptional regulator [Pseudolabrys sp.]
MWSHRGAQSAPAGSNSRPYNNLLRHLRDTDYALVAPHLESVERNTDDLLYSAGDNVETVYFPCGASLVSYLVGSEDGRDVETVLVGREGAVGGIVSHGHLPAYCRITVKHGGSFVRLPVDALEASKLKSPSMRYLFARYADCLMAQMFQATACNAIHSIEQRTAKLIVAAMERTGNDLVPLTHEQLASMLGVGRSYTSRVMKTFKTEGVLETRRGALLVKNLGALKQLACHCNEAVKGHFEEVLSGVYPREAQ